MNKQNHNEMFISTEGVFNVVDYGADPSGCGSSTAAVQAAIDAAGAYQNGQGGMVLVPPGTYLVSNLHMHPTVTLQGCIAWGYKRKGNCVLQLDPDAEDAVCLLDLTGAFSCTVSDLELYGGQESTKSPVHGIYIHHDKLGGEGGQKEEDFPTISNCKIDSFSGDAVHLHNVWAFRMRGCQLRKACNGLYLHGATDGFLYDCLFTSNRLWGIFADPEGGHNSSFQISGCRVEWNRKGGFYLSSACNWQITQNSFDRNFGPALHCASSGHRRLPHSNGISIVGNNFNRNGTQALEDDNSHLILDNIFNAVVVANTFVAGAQDNLEGTPYPRYALVAHALKTTVIANNVMQNACTEQVLLDHGDHYERQNDTDELCGMIWRDNPGSAASSGCYHPTGHFMPCRE